MPGENEDFVGNEDAVDLEAGTHAKTPAEAGFGSLAEVLEETGGVHEKVAHTMKGTGEFPEPTEDFSDREED